MLAVLLMAAVTVDPRAEMRRFVISLREHGESRRPGFLLIPQNGLELLDDAAYRAAIDAVGREDLFFGYDGDDRPTPPDVTDAWVDSIRSAGLPALVIDYCTTAEHVEQARSRAAELGFLSYVADRRELDSVSPFAAADNASDVTSLADARNFLYLINPGDRSRRQLLGELTATRHDLLIIDPECGGRLTPVEVESLGVKANGAERLVIAYLSIGEAEDYRDYWSAEWASHPPAWLAEENPDWPGNFKVRYWDPDWQAVIRESLDRIIDAGFDGAYLDLVDAFEYFED